MNTEEETPVEEVVEETPPEPRQRTWNIQFSQGAVEANYVSWKPKTFGLRELIAHIVGVTPSMIVIRDINYSPNEDDWAWKQWVIYSVAGSKVELQMQLNISRW